MDTIDYYNAVYDIVTTWRHEDRASAIMDLTQLLLDENYHDALSEIFLDSQPSIENIESIIINLSVKLGHVFGIALDPEGVNEHPKEAVRALLGVISAIENYEDQGELYGLVMSDEEPVYKYQEILRTVFGDTNIHLQGVVVLVEPRTMTALTNLISANQYEEDTTVNPNLIAYLRYFPQNPSSWAFLNAGDNPNTVTLAQMLDWDPEAGVSEIDLTIIYSTGLVVLISKELSDALERCEDMVKSVLPPDLDPDQNTNSMLEVGEIVLSVKKALTDIMGGSDEQE